MQDNRPEPRVNLNTPCCSLQNGSTVKPLWIAFCLLFWTASLLAADAEKQVGSAPFSYVDKHIIAVPVTVGDIQTHFILDTGAGVNLLSERLAKQLSCHPSQRFSGRRMSGQKLRMNITSIPSVRFANHEGQNVPSAIWDMEKLFQNDPECKGIEGILSLNYFRNTPFTIDYPHRRILIENENSIELRRQTGYIVPVKLEERRGIESGAKLKLDLSKGRSAWVEVDTGSSSLILDTRYMKLFKLEKDSSRLKKVVGKDETDHSYVRYFGKLEADICPAGASKAQQVKPDVMFQKIIHDGLIGDSFLRNFVVTYDLPRKQMIFALPSAPTTQQARSDKD